MEVREVEGRDAIVRGYRELFAAAYEGVPGWHDPPMPFHLARLDPRQEPIWRTAPKALFFAYEGGRAVGRVLAFVPPEQLERPLGARAGRFGLFDCVAAPAVGDALLAAACDWLRGEGCTEVAGPFAFSMHDEVGLLVDGFDEPPSFLMPFNPPAAQAHLERAGFAETRRFWTYEWELERDRVPLGQDRKDERPPAGLTLRAFNLRERERETAGLLEVYNAAFADNWGFTALTADECRMFVDQFIRFGDPRLVRVAELDGRLVGFVLTVPDPNRLLHATRGQPGWLRLARLMLAVKLKRLRHARVITLAVRPELRHHGIGHALIRDNAESAIARGFRTGEMSYIDAGNEAMNTILGDLRFPRRKTYAVFRRAL
ncbi:MAG TPA: GNAT family N-acetyltransferase [Polyangia bacterium]|jgi:GNAT superfamily N-acetyltransferase